MSRGSQLQLPVCMGPGTCLSLPTPTLPRWQRCRRTLRWQLQPMEGMLGTCLRPSLPLPPSRCPYMIYTRPTEIPAASITMTYNYTHHITTGHQTFTLHLWSLLVNRTTQSETDILTTKITPYDSCEAPWKPLDLCWQQGCRFLLNLLTASSDPLAHIY